MQDFLPLPLNKDTLDQTSSIREEKQSEILQQLSVPKYKDGIDFVFEQNSELGEIAYSLIKKKNITSKVCLKNSYSHVYDIIFDNIIIGRLELPLDLDGDSVMIWDIVIDEEYRNKKLGLEAYKAAILLSPKPILSFLASPEANRVRESLVRQGFAEKMEWGYTTNTKHDILYAKQLYSEYLDTIFLESQMRDIVYHNSDDEFKDVWFKPMPSKFDTLNSVEGVYNFSTNRKFIQRYGKITYAVLLNIKQAVSDSNSGEYLDDLDRPLSELLFKLWKQRAANMLAPKYDPSLKNTDALIHYITGEEYVEKHPVSGREFGLPKQTLISVFDPNQIHILWSQRDIAWFKQWIQNKQ